MGNTNFLGSSTILETPKQPHTVKEHEGSKSNKSTQDWSLQQAQKSEWGESEEIHNQFTNFTSHKDPPIDWRGWDLGCEREWMHLFESRSIVNSWEGEEVNEEREPKGYIKALKSCWPFGFPAQNSVQLAFSRAELGPRSLMSSKVDQLNLGWTGIDHRGSRSTPLLSTWLNRAKHGWTRNNPGWTEIDQRFSADFPAEQLSQPTLLGWTSPKAGWTEFYQWTPLSLAEMPLRACTTWHFLGNSLAKEV